MCVCVCVCVCAASVWFAFADRCVRLVSVLADDERCWMIQITYGFLLDWLDSACVNRGEDDSRDTFNSFG